MPSYIQSTNRVARWNFTPEFTYGISTKSVARDLYPYVEEISGDYECGFRRGISLTDHTFV
jgi:hypothetical protein